MGVGPISTAALDMAAHLGDDTDAHDATAISLAPITGLGNPANVQSALAAIPSRYAPLFIATLADIGSIAAYDSFNRPDSGTLPGTPDSGGSYTVHAGTWGITSNRLRLQAVSTTPAPITYNAATADATVQVVIQCSADTPGPGIALRVTDADTMLIVRVNAAGVRLLKRVSGTETQLAAWNTASNVGRRRWLRAAAAGNVVSCVDMATGLTIGTHTLAGGDEVTFAAQTQHGVFDLAASAGRISSFDDLVIRLPF